MLRSSDMIQRGSDVKVVKTDDNFTYALYVNGGMRISGTADDVIGHILHSFNISFQHVTLGEEVMDIFDGVLPQRYQEIDEVVEDLKNCELF